jgi:hypothetical protein
MSGDSTGYQDIIFYSKEMTITKKILLQHKRKQSMTDLLFHVYDKKSEVIVHSLSVEELEKMLKEEEISTREHDIVPVWEPPYDEASY